MFSLLITQLLYHVTPGGASRALVAVAWPCAALLLPGQPALLAFSHAVVDEQGDQATAGDDKHDDPHGQPDETAWVERTLILVLLLMLLRCNAVIVVTA